MRQVLGVCVVYFLLLLIRNETLCTHEDVCVVYFYFSSFGVNFRYLPVRTTELLLLIA